MNPEVRKFKFSLLNLFCGSTIIFLYCYLFNLQEDWVPVIFLSVIACIIFPVFTEVKDVKKDE